MGNKNKIQSLFPILKSSVNDNNLVYLDNAATTQKPNSVIAEINKFYREENSNIHRGVHYLSQVATKKYENSRLVTQKFINARHSHEIIFTKGTTDSINLLASSFGQLLKKGDEIIISEMEHHSNMVPWQMCCERSGATLQIIPCNKMGELDLDMFNQLISNKTKIVSVTHISNSLGTINPIKKIIAISHQKNAQVIVDGAQAAAHLKLDMQKLDADFYCFSAHKLYGPTGVGVLYGKENLLNLLPPYQGGGEMIKDVSLLKTTYADLPHKFEAGTPNIAGIIGFKKSLDFITETGLDNIKKHEDKLLDHATKKLNSIKGLKIIGTSSDKSAIISFIIQGIHHYDLGLLLDKMGVAIRTGHHCTQPIMKKFKISGTSRISFAYYNTIEEIDHLILAINKAIKMLS